MRGGVGASILPSSFDSVVLATGRRPARDLIEGIDGLVEEVLEVGDCREPRSVFYAVHEATRAALQIGEDAAAERDIGLAGAAPPQPGGRGDEGPA